MQYPLVMRILHLLTLTSLLFKVSVDHLSQSLFLQTCNCFVQYLLANFHFLLPFSCKPAIHNDDLRAPKLLLLNFLIKIWRDTSRVAWHAKPIRITHRCGLKTRHLLRPLLIYVRFRRRKINLFVTLGGDGCRILVLGVVDEVLGGEHLLELDDGGGNALHIVE
jgi:hypothetical protein